MANKTEIVGPVRIEPALMEQMKQVAEDMGISVYELSRVAMAELVRRHQVKTEWTQAVHLADHEPLGGIPS
jgi:hypothetical protein